MKDLKIILAEYGKIDFSTRKAALATVVKVNGSSYRSPGARMLITDDGKWVGSISGGCLEGDALRKARKVISDKKPMTVTYDTREESNQNLGIGLGCNGVIHVLIEPLDPIDKLNAVRGYEKFITDNQPIALATIYDSDNSSLVGQKISLDNNGQLDSGISNTHLTSEIKADLERLFIAKKSSPKGYVSEGSNVDVFLELIQPGISVIIFGGGFDARPVSALAKSLGWSVTVTDECVAHIAPLFFPDADKLSLCERKFIDRDFEITPFTACVLMSHNYEYDRDVLKKIVKTDTPYIGMLGPRKRFDKMLSEFKDENFGFTADQLHKIHSPIGLDVGAETPDEIAISIISEIQAKFTSRSGGFLKYKSGPIHDRDEESDQVFKQVYLNDSAGFRKAKD